MKYYERLKDMREDHDLKQSDIAKILNTTSQKISEYENGNIMMRIDKYIKLAKYYNVSIDYLTGIIETPRELYEQNKPLKALTEKQKKLLKAYSDNPKLQAAVDKLLDIGE